MDNARGRCSWLMHLHLGSHWPKSLLYPTSFKTSIQFGLFSPPNAHHRKSQSRDAIRHPSRCCPWRTMQRPQQHDMAWRRLLVASTTWLSNTRQHSSSTAAVRYSAASPVGEGEGAQYYVSLRMRPTLPPRGPINRINTSVPASCYGAP